MLRIITNFSFLLIFLLEATLGFGQTNITPIRNQVSGFGTWTDVSISNTNYLQMTAPGGASNTTTPTMDFTPYSSITLDFKARTFGGVNTTKNTVTVSISTDNGGSYTVIGTRIPTSSTPNSVTQFSLSSYTSFSQVKIRFAALNADGSIGAGIDDIDIKGTTASCTPPTTQATSLVASGFGQTSATLGWTRGNGDNVIVLAKAGSAVNADPTSGTSYSADAAFGNGSQIGSGNYVVYNGTGTSVNLSSLNANTAYHFAVYEYANTGNCYHLTELTGNLTSLCNTPTTNSSSPVVSALTSTSASVSWTNGNGSNRLVILSAGTAVTTIPVDGTTYSTNSSYNLGSPIAPSATDKAIFGSTGSSAAINSLTSGTTYYGSIFEYNNASKCYFQTGATFSFTTPSASSDIVFVSSTESSCISSILNGNMATVSDGTQIGQYTIRDGGTGMNDGDLLPTIINSITFTQGSGNQVSNWSNIQSVALFNGSTLVATGTPGASSVVFSGTPLISVADNSSVTLSLRLTIKSSVSNPTTIDGQDFVFSITNSNVVVASNSSGYNSSAPVASSANGQNVVCVSATSMIFGQQPASTSTNVAFNPAVTIQVVDANGNLDLGFTNTVAISSTGTLAGGSTNTATAPNGVATFGNIQHSQTGTGLTITASTSGLSIVTSTAFDILQQTTLQTGDLIILAVNATNGSSCGGGSAAEDNVYMVAFVDITPNTTLDFTDNGWDRANTGYFGTGEGVYRFNRTGATIPAGTVFMMRFPSTQPIASDNPGWSFTSLNSGANLNMNTGGDQLFVMQGGAWVNGGTSLGSYNNGRILYGFNTKSAWNTLANTTTDSGLPTTLSCGNTTVSGSASDYVRYSGSLVAATPSIWFQRINNISNWTVESSCANFNSNFTITSIDINSTGNTTKWVGNASGDINNWFNCANWEHNRVPNEETDVTIDATALTSCEILATEDFSDNFNDIAKCKNLTITGMTLKMEGNAMNKLEIHGNLTINSGGLLDCNDGTATVDGSITLYGNWINEHESNYDEGQSKVIFEGNTTADISVNTGTKEVFYNILINKPSNTLVTLSDNMEVSSELAFGSGGIISTGSNRVEVSSSAAAAITGYGASGSTDKYIRGTLRRNVAAATLYQLPIGDASHGHQRAQVEFNSLNGVTYVETYYSSASANSNATDQITGCDVDNNNQTNEKFDYQLLSGTWEVTANVITGLDYNAGFFPAGANPTGGVVNNMKHDGSYVLTCNGTQANDALLNSNTNHIQNNLTHFTPFQIGSGTTALPIELISFHAKRTQEDVLLNWATATEINNSHFEIERSFDGIEFSTLSLVNGQGNAAYRNDYRWVDAKAPSSRLYYRLKQVDFDGTYSYTPIASVEASNENGFDVVVLGNPVKDELRLSLINKRHNNFVTICIYSFDGKLIKNDSYQSENIEINTKELTNGAYFIKIDHENGSTLKRFIKK